jgi:hypothetical protein
LPADGVATRPLNDDAAMRYPRGRKVAAKLALPGRIDPQSVICEAGAKRNGVGVLSRSATCPTCSRPPGVAPEQQLSPTLAARVATHAQHFERRGDPNNLGCLVRALDFDGEAIGTHLGHAIEYKGLRPSSKGLAAAAIIRCEP